MVITKWWKSESQIGFYWRTQSLNHTNPIVITFPVVHNKPAWCCPLKCPKWTLTNGRTAFSSVASHRISHFQMATTRNKRLHLFMPFLRWRLINASALFKKSGQRHSLFVVLTWYVIYASRYGPPYPIPVSRLLRVFFFFFFSFWFSFAFALHFLSFFFIYLVCPWPRREHQENL